MGLFAPRVGAASGDTQVYKNDVLRLSREVGSAVSEDGGGVREFDEQAERLIWCRILTSASL